MAYLTDYGLYMTVLGVTCVFVAVFFISFKKDRYPSKSKLKSSDDLTLLLNKAQQISKIGSWDFYPLENKLLWSDELFRIFEINEDTVAYDLYTEYKKRVHPEDWPALEAMIQKAINEGLGYQVDHRIITASGNVKYIRGTAEVYLNADKKIYRLAGVAQDVTQQVRDQDEILKKTKELDKFFLLTADMLCILNHHAQLMRVNAAFEKILEHSAERLIGQPLLSFIHSEDISYCLSQLETLDKVETNVRFETRMRCKNGHYKTLQWTASSDQASGLIFASARDVSEERRREQEFKQIMNAIEQSTMVLISDPVGRVVSANDLYLSTTGYTLDEILGHNYFLEKAGLDSDQYYKYIWKCISGGRSWSGEIRTQAKDGQELIMSVIIVPLFKDDGSLDRYLSFRFDMTSQRKLHNQLLEAQSIAKIGSWEYNFANNNLWWSSEHYKIFEIEESESKLNLFEIYKSKIHPDDLEKLESYIELAKNYGQDYVYDHRVLLDDGKRIKYVQGIGRVIKDAEGNTTSICGTCRDRTQEVLLEMQILNERAIALQSAKLASLGEMAAGVAHEINNPLAIIDGTIRMLPQIVSDADKFSKKLETIKKSCDRIAKIVNGLRKYSRASERMDLRPNSLKLIIEEASVITETRSKQASTLVDYDLQTDALVECDAMEIEQVIINLMNNAVDAVKKNDEKWVRVELLEVTDQVVLRIIDSGLGISPEVEDKLFQPFFTTKPVGEGTGLGLSICKGILDKHKATIAINRDYANTCFEIRFQKSRRVELDTLQTA